MRRDRNEGNYPEQPWQNEYAGAGRKAYNDYDYSCDYSYDYDLGGTLPDNGEDSYACDYNAGNVDGYHDDYEDDYRDDYEDGYHDNYEDVYGEYVTYGRRQASAASGEEYDGIIEDDFEGNNESGKESIKPRRRRSWKDIILWLIPSAALMVFVSSAVYLVPRYLEYRRAIEGYASLEENTIRLWEKAVYVQAQQDPGEPEEEDVNEQMISFPMMEIDFDELKGINEDFVGVLYIPVLEVVYPVTHSKDNREYEKLTFARERNSSGAIFLDALNNRDLSDRNSFIYGHNMKNLTMFGKLKYFMAYPDLCDNDPYFYIYTPDKVFKYRIFAYYAVNTRDEIYALDSYDWTDADYDEFIRTCSYRTLYWPDDPELDFSLRPQLMNLSTCFGNDHVNNFIVHGALIGTGSYQEALRQMRSENGEDDSADTNGTEKTGDTEGPEAAK